MNFEFRELINPEKYYYFSIISQIPIWTVFLINLFSQNSNGNDVFNDQSNPNYYMPARIFEPCQSCLLIREQVWRLVSYSFIHIDFNHLFFNSLGLLIYSYINYFYQSRFLFFIYGSGILLGALSFFFFNPYGILIGNSGGVYSLIGSSLGSQLINFSTFQKEFNIILMIFNILPVFLLFNYYFLDSNKGTAYVCHLYGYLIGVLSSLMILPRFNDQDYHNILELIGLAGYLILFLFFSYGYLTLPYLDEPRFSNECCY